MSSLAAAATKFPPLLLDTSTKPVNSFSVKKGGRPHCQNQKGYTYSYSNQDQRQTRKQRKQRGDQSLQQVAVSHFKTREMMVSYTIFLTHYIAFYLSMNTEYGRPTPTPTGTLPAFKM